MFTLILLACTEPLWYPQPPGADTGEPVGATGDTALEIPCSDPAASQLTTVSVVNRSGVEGLELYWRDQACGETLYYVLSDGQQQPVETYIGHVWVARAASTYVDHYTAEAGGSWEIGP